MARYEDTQILRDKNSQRYLSTEDYPSFDKKDTDVIIRARFGQRMDNLANEYYGDSALWWVIAKSNVDLFDGGLFLKPGEEYRIPTDLSSTGDEIITGGGIVGSIAGSSGG
jgi:nucleoid-associated protein YgaU